MTARDDEGFTPLQAAANAGCFDTIITLLKYCNLDTSTGASDVPPRFLKWAAVNNKADTLQVNIP